MTTITLQTPVTVGGTTYTKLTFRRPKAKDMAAADHAGGSGHRGNFAVYASMSDVETNVIAELDWSDYLVVQHAAEGLLGKCLEEAGEVLSRE